MDQRSQNRTIFVKKQGQPERRWFIFDASGKTLGRFASEITKILRGKHTTHFTPNMDCGDGVIIINAEKIEVTGTKEAQKLYTHYTGSMSGLRQIPYRTMKIRKPTYILRHAVQGMMPKTKLAKTQLKRLRIFAGENHKMEAQQPIEVSI